MNIPNNLIIDGDMDNVKKAEKVTFKGYAIYVVVILTRIASLGLACYVVKKVIFGT